MFQTVDLLLIDFTCHVVHADYNQSISFTSTQATNMIWASSSVDLVRCLLRTKSTFRLRHSCFIHSARRGFVDVGLLVGLCRAAPPNCDCSYYIPMGPRVFYLYLSVHTVLHMTINTHYKKISHLNHPLKKSPECHSQYRAQTPDTPSGTST